jgi:hypothetical protein
MLRLRRSTDSVAETVGLAPRFVRREARARLPTSGTRSVCREGYKFGMGVGLGVHTVLQRAMAINQ